MKWSYTECGFLSYLGSDFVLCVNYTSQVGKHIMHWLNHVFSLIKYRGHCPLRLKKNEIPWLTHLCYIRIL